MHQLNVLEKYYKLLESGAKTIELRLFDDKRKAIKVGDVIEFTNAADKEDKFLAEVIYLHRAADFAALGDKIDCRQAGFSTKDELVEVLEEFYSDKRQKEFGVVGIEVKRI